MSESRMMQLLLSVIWTIPYLLIYVAGLTLSILRREQNPARSRLTIPAFALFILGLLISKGVWFAYMVAMENSYASAHAFSSLFTLSSAITNLLDIAGWVLLLMAVFKEYKAR